ncbi:MlaD family protein [Aldersonia kunmingensis]|uniref:MlaD family protein n=1 Tax=Aldersonia kunmingensis TaxID=408066 RepID=UPI0008295A6F|nr:MlaD family protein [Aldersonia kunmingensis]
MNRVGTIASLGAIVAILVVGVTYLALGVAKVSWPGNSDINASMVLSDSGGLVPRSKVLLSGIEVGRVADVRHGGEQVTIDLRLDDKYRIPAASEARIESLSGLGEPYLQFVPAGTAGPYIEDGQLLGANQVSLPASMPEVAQQSTALLQQVNPDTINSVVATFSNALTGTEAVIPQIARSTDLLAAALLSRTDVIRNLLLDLQRNATDMSWAGPALAESAAPWRAFGPKTATAIVGFGRMIAIGDTPSDYLIDRPNDVGLIPFLDQTSDRLQKIGPDLLKLTPVMEPLIEQNVKLVQQLDLGALIEQALNATSEDGTLRLQIQVK